jgi:hypothetical protein
MKMACYLKRSNASDETNRKTFKNCHKPKKELGLLNN